jgi:hypothetical protein
MNLSDQKWIGQAGADAGAEFAFDHIEVMPNISHRGDGQRHDVGRCTLK